VGEWGKGRGALGPLKPLLGDWIAEAGGEGAAGALRCSRSFRAFGKAWVELDARWEMGSRGTYREIALFGAGPDGDLVVFSFTNDGKRSEGRRVDGSDVHPLAIAFESEMPAGTARMIYWPAESGEGFHFAVENRTKRGWNRFLLQTYRVGSSGE
jgi:hypothetical protein